MLKIIVYIIQAPPATRDNKKELRRTYYDGISILLEAASHTENQIKQEKDRACRTPSKSEFLNEYIELGVPPKFTRCKIVRVQSESLRRWCPYTP